MKKLLLTGLMAGIAMTAFSQVPGISDVAVYDDFKTASQYSDQYSIKTSEVLCGSGDTAYKGLFTYEDKTFATDGIGLSVNRNMSSGALELDIEQGKGKYEPFGFIFGTYCVGDASGVEKEFTLDLSKNAVLSFTVEVESFTDQYDNSGSTTADRGVQIKIQAEDINGYSLVYDKAAVNDATQAWKYELGVTGDGEQASNDFAGTGISSLSQGETVNISYDLKDAIPGNDASDAPATDGRTFDYSQVKSIKITFSNARKDTDAGYDPYKHTGSYSITNFKLGDVNEILGLNEVFSSSVAIAPNPASGVATVSFDGDALVLLTDLIGNEVASASGTSSASLDVSGLATGIYVVSIVKEGSVVAIEKLIVQ